MNAQLADLSLPLPFDTFRAFRTTARTTTQSFSFGELDLRRLGGLTLVVAVMAAFFVGFSSSVGLLGGDVGFLGFLIAFGTFVVGFGLRTVGTYRKLFANERGFA